MVALCPLAQEGVNLIYEHDTGLCLARQGEQSCDELVGLSVPLVRQYGRGDIDERRARLLRESLREHRLSASWWAKQQDALRGTEEGGGREEVGIEQGVYDGFAKGGYDGVQSANVLWVRAHDESRREAEKQTKTHQRIVRRCRLGE